nr:MAG TPA: hypothetical protein [Caudoviricetes sp.]
MRKILPFRKFVVPLYQKGQGFPELRTKKR